MKTEWQLPFASSLVYDIFVVVVSEAPTELFVVHLWLVLSQSPPPGHLIRLVQLELPILTRPRYDVLASSVSQELKEKLPQLNRSTSLYYKNTIQFRTSPYLLDMRNAHIKQNSLSAL